MMVRVNADGPSGTGPEDPANKPDLSLRDMRILLTRPAAQAGPWRDALAAAGAHVIAFPTTTIGPPPSWEPLDRALANLASYDWLLFSSAAAVELAVTRLAPSLDRAAIRPQVAAVGSETGRALEKHGFRVALVPKAERQEGLVAAWANLAPGTRILFPRAVEGRDDVINALTARGVKVDLAFASQTKQLPLSPPPPFDVSLFASPSALTSFVTQLGAGSLAAHPMVVIGPTTASAAHAAGLMPHVATSPSVTAVIQAIAALDFPSPPVP